jgi:hypothetical protein
MQETEGEPTHDPQRPDSVAGVRGLELANVALRRAGPNSLVSQNIFVPETFRENCNVGCSCSNHEGIGAAHGSSSRFIAFAGVGAGLRGRSAKSPHAARRSARSCRRPGGPEGRTRGTAW